MCELTSLELDFGYESKPPDDFDVGFDLGFWPPQTFDDEGD